MSKRILLITGWGGGAALLAPLQAALQQHGHVVERINIFNAFDEAVLQHQVELARQFDVIIGWSLGGQLATVLVDKIQQKYQQAQILITLASNPCFVAQADWTTAMRPETFMQFKQSFAQDAISTLKRFGYLVCQGASSAKQDFLAMQKMLQPQPMALLQQGLVLLEQLNLVEMYKSYQATQLHVFAEHDALVPYQISENMQHLAARKLSVVVVDGASHGFPCFMVQQTVQVIEDFLAQSV